MKKSIIFMTLILLASQLLAVSNLKVNGATGTTITSSPCTVIVTCDLATTGNDVELLVFIDGNNNKSLERDDILTDFYVITDGIGWIRNPENPDENIPGDETAVDKKLQTTLEFRIRATPGTIMFIKVKDKDGSQATALITIDIPPIPPIPPIIKGKVTDKQDGAALPNINVIAYKKLADGRRDYTEAKTDGGGNYQLGVTTGNWFVVAEDHAKQQYAPSDTVEIPIAANQTVTKDFQLEKYKNFIEGTVKKQDGTPVPGIGITYIAINPSGPTGMVYTDDSGYYKIGATPGQISLFINPYTSTSFHPEAWPDGSSPDPISDTVNVAAGQTVQVNFTFKPYTSFIEGTCKANGSGLGSVMISATAMDGMIITTSKEDGSYKLGLLPGTILSLDAGKDGYELIDPFGGYYDFEVPAGQSVTGKDFTFQADGYITGTITFEDSSPAGSVYVVATHHTWWVQDRSNYLILHTDASGAYKFSNIPSIQWKVGVFKAGYVSHPYLQWVNVTPNSPAHYADFILGKDTAVADADDELIPTKFDLEQNYPNPFKPGSEKDFTSIRFYIDKTTAVQISIYNIAGQLVKRIDQGSVKPGPHQFKWDGRDELGNLVPSGVYIYHLQAGDKSMSKRMIIVR